MLQMASRIVIDGNAFYEIDEECMQRKKEKRREEQTELQGKQILKRDECGVRGLRDES